MSLIKLDCKIDELGTARIKNLIPVIILDCNGLLSGSQGLNVRFSYQEFYESYREMVSENEKEAAKLLGKVVAGVKSTQVEQAILSKSSKEPIFGIFGFCTSVSKNVTEDKVTHKNKREYDYEKIGEGIAEINKMMQSFEWSDSRVLVYATEDPEFISVLKYIYDGNDQFKALVCKD